MRDKICSVMKKAKSVFLAMSVRQRIAAACVLCAALLMVAAGCVFALTRPSQAEENTESTEQGSSLPTDDINPNTPDGARGTIACSREPNRNAPGLYFIDGKMTVAEGESKASEIQAYFETDRVTVVWVSEDEAVASVDADGIVTGVSTGVTTVSVMTVDFSYSASLTVSVTERKKDDAQTEAGSAPIDSGGMSAAESSGETLYYPENSTKSEDLPAQAPSTVKPSDQMSASVQKNLSAQPTVALCAQVATGIYIVGGSCTASTEYIRVSGTSVGTTEIVPTPSASCGYFFGQVHISAGTTLLIQGKETGHELSEAVARQVENRSMANQMTANDYMPVFGKQSRIHFYSAVLSYTLSDAIPSSIADRASELISANVDTLREANPEAEMIFLVVPSSAAVYPETLPEEYTAAAGKTIFETFEQIATSRGATVIYPLDTFLAHKNDGAGYKIYQNTDSHWSAYGAYFGVSALMEHIAQRYPTAKPRSLDSMGFYTTELWGGDALFSFGDGAGFEDVSRTGFMGRTSITKIGEFTTLYSRTMATSTLSQVYRGNKSVYVGTSNSAAATFVNPAGGKLPTALVLRDSFGCTAYDMINDRFSTVWWQESHKYTFPVEAVEKYQPDYVIYIVSERNLLKIMLENSDASLSSLN